MAANPDLTDRGIVFLSGGAVYAMTTMLMPEATNKKQVDLTTKDIAAYADLVRKSPITSPALEAAKGTPVEKEVKNVFDTFTPTNLVAGSEILTALASTLKLEGKTLRFDRTAIMAVMRGKVLEQAEKDFPPSPPPAPAPAAGRNAVAGSPASVPPPTSGPAQSGEKGLGTDSPASVPPPSTSSPAQPGEKDSDAGSTPEKPSKPLKAPSKALPEASPPRS